MATWSEPSWLSSLPFISFWILAAGLWVMFEQAPSLLSSPKFNWLSFSWTSILDGYTTWFDSSWSSSLRLLISIRTLFRFYCWLFTESTSSTNRSFPSFYFCGVYIYFLVTSSSSSRSSTLIKLWMSLCRSSYECLESLSVLSSIMLFSALSTSMKIRSMFESSWSGKLLSELACELFDESVLTLISLSLLRLRRMMLSESELSFRILNLFCFIF